MKALKNLIVLLATALCAQAGFAQNLKIDEAEGKANYILLSRDTVEVAYSAGFNSVAVMSNVDSYEVTSTSEDNDWVTCLIEGNGNLTFFADYYYETLEPRYATFTVSATDGSFSREIVVKQNQNTSADDIGDEEITISSGTASASQSGEGVEYSYDGDTSTYWHSPWYSTSFPVTLTYTFSEASHIDYMVYIPRQDGNTNGNWGEITVSYATSSATSTFVDYTSVDLGESSDASTVTFGKDGIDEVKKVKITINSGSGNLASCAEIAFYSKDQTLNSLIDEYFTSNLCDELKEGVSEDDVNSIPNAYMRLLAKTLFAGDYSTTYRVNTFGAYTTIATLKSALKTNYYSAYENPTGIYFDEGEKVVVFADGITDSYPVSLKIANFSNEDDISDEGQTTSSYSLMNGANVITATNRGNAYVSYYTDSPEEAPEISLHFAMAQESGYFDSTKGLTNSDWENLLAGAVSDIVDILTPRLHVAAPLAVLKSYCPSNGVELAEIYDGIVEREREVMGLLYYDSEPRNHQFARPVSSGMYADGTGAAASFGSFNTWVNVSDFDFWGLGHELGHINQIRPDFLWSGCGETTNNIYASWAQHKLGAKDAYGTGYHRLEDEVSGIDSYSSTRGGRFETYLEEGVRKGVSWQLQDGPDYYGTEASEVTVSGEDENGNSTGTVTTTSRNYDHFVKVVPFWQLMLYTQEAGQSPNAFGKMIEGMRNSSTTGLTNGQWQILMMKRFCDSTKVNFLPFFEKAGLLKPIKAYIEDYTAGWLIITEDMISELEEYIEAKGYQEAPEGLNYINAYNWEVFRDKGTLPTDQEIGTGCTATGTKVRVKNASWPNAVGYETYDEDDNLVRISMFGLGDSQMSDTYTYVLFPSGSSYIMAVGYDGTRVKIYEK